MIYFFLSNCSICKLFLFLCLYANFCEPGVHCYQFYCVQSTSSPILKSLVPVVHLVGGYLSLWYFMYDKLQQFLLLEKPLPCNQNLPIVAKIHHPNGVQVWHLYLVFWTLADHYRSMVDSNSQYHQDLHIYSITLVMHFVLLPCWYDVWLLAGVWTSRCWKKLYLLHKWTFS